MSEVIHHVPLSDAMYNHKAVDLKTHPKIYPTKYQSKAIVLTRNLSTQQCKYSRYLIFCSVAVHQIETLQQELAETTCKYER